MAYERVNWLYKADIVEIGVVFLVRKVGKARHNNVKMGGYAKTGLLWGIFA